MQVAISTANGLLAITDNDRTVSAKLQNSAGELQKLVPACLEAGIINSDPVVEEANVLISTLDKVSRDVRQ